MQSSDLGFIRSAWDAGTFFTATRDLLSAGFPNRVFSLYVLGSRADETAIATSDVDLAVVFQNRLDSQTRSKAETVVRAIRRISPIVIDVILVGREELRRGVTPKLKEGRLLAGPDVIKECPLKSKSELMLFNAGLVVHFIQAIRGNPGTFRFPLDYPACSGIYRGYEVNGIRVAEGNYRPGFNMLVNLVMCIGTFRLAWLADVFTPSKRITAAKYRTCLPNDPWCALIEDVYRICRIQTEGQLPRAKTDRARLSQCCERVLEFENECLETAIVNLDRWLPTKDRTFQRQVVDFADHVVCDSAAHAAKLKQIKARWPRSD